MPAAQCTLRPLGVTYNLIINRDTPPFNDPKARAALALTLDRKSFIDITSEGRDIVGGSMLPPPAGVWGVGAEELKDLPGYGGDVEASREKGRALMRELGYGPEKRLKMKVSTRNSASYRDLAVILIDHLKHIYIDGELELIDSAVYFNRLYQKNYTIVLNATGSSLDDPTSTSWKIMAATRRAISTATAIRSYGAHRQAVARGRRREAPRDGARYRAQAHRGQRPTHHPAQQRRGMHAAAGQECDHHGEQHLQRLALRGCLARPLIEAGDAKTHDTRQRGTRHIEETRGAS